MATKKTAGSKTATGKGSVPLDPKIADELLNLLSTDNEFRRLFKKDPQAALVRAGSPKAVSKGVAKARKGLSSSLSASPPAGACMKVGRIAPKQEIARARNELKNYLTSMVGYTTPHAFEAGKVMGAVRKK